MSSKEYLGCHPLPFFWELGVVSGEIIRPSMCAEHVQYDKHNSITCAMQIFWQQWRLTCMGDAHF